VAEMQKLAERRVRARIRRTFSKRRTGAGAMRTLEDQVLKLIHDYSSAPENEKDEVYERAEKRLVRAVRSETLHG